jgi:hypothetical protein
MRQLHQIYIGLRKQALEMSPASIDGAVRSDNIRPWGILMEIGYPQGVATLVSFATGDASLYFSTGGGVLGGIAQESVGSAARRFVSMAQHHAGLMETATSFPLPDPGKVKFYALVREGALTAEAGEQQLGRGKSDLSPLFYAGQDVITELRILCQAHEK